MNNYLIDTGFLYALINENDSNHRAVISANAYINGKIILPVPAITEVCYFLNRNFNISILADFLDDLSSTQDMIIETPAPQDYRRSAEILRKYNDSNIDFVDACIVAMAERLNITQILTVDHRHFRMFKPEHCESFELIPQTL